MATQNAEAAHALDDTTSTIANRKGATTKICDRQPKIRRNREHACTQRRISVECRQRQHTRIKPV